MRDIKFRAWDNRQNKYLNPDDVSISADGFITIFNADGKHSRAVQPPGDLSPWFIIEQYTGLKDKTGIEIYEGDVVQYYPRHNGVPYRVYWANESAKFLIGRKGVVGQELSSVMYNLDTGRIVLEVIGNIHENPKLGEEEK